MRKPKIGDIVHYHSSNNGFIPIICKVVHVKEPPLRLYLKDTNNGFAFAWEEGSHLCFSDYWSWPEEEKPVYTKPFQPVFEFGMSAGGSGGSDDIKEDALPYEIKNTNKAEKLIGQIYKETQRRYKTDATIDSELICLIEILIEDYKGKEK